MCDSFPVTELGRVAGFTLGQSPDSETYISEKVGLPFLQGCAEFGAKNPIPTIYCNPPLRIAKKGSFFDEDVRLEVLADCQGVLPLQAPYRLFGTWPGNVDDGFEELICDLRNRNTTGSSLK